MFRNLDADIGAFRIRGGVGFVVFHTVNDKIENSRQHTQTQKHPQPSGIGHHARGQWGNYDLHHLHNHSKREEEHNVRNNTGQNRPFKVPRALIG